MAATWIKLRVPAFGQPANTVLRVDTPDQAAQLLNGGFADLAADPGGSPPAVPAGSPGGDYTTDAELAAALAGVATAPTTDAAREQYIPARLSDAGLRAAIDAEITAQGTSGKELAYAEATANQQTSTGWGATTAGGAALAGLSVTFTVGARPFIVEAQILGSTNTAGTGCVLQIFDETGTEVARTYAQLAAAGNSLPLRVKRRLSVAAGTSKTYTARIGTLGASTVTSNAGATYPAFIHAVEC